MAIIGLALFGLFAIGLAAIFAVKSRRAGSLEVDRHNQYNELISEVSVLLQEKVEQVKLKHELATASAVQEMIFPQEEISYEGVSIKGKVRMPNACGGDWWFHARVGDEVCIWIGDVTGHGIPSALVASACRAAAESIAKLGVSEPERAVTLMNQILYSMTKGKLFVTAFYASVNCSTGTVRFVNASHPSAVYIRADATTALLPETLNPALGTQPFFSYKGNHAQLEPSGILLLVTDGVLDYPHPLKAMWTVRRFLKFCSEAAGADHRISSVVQRLEAKLSVAGNNFEDDLTYVALQWDKNTALQAKTGLA